MIDQSQMRDRIANVVQLGDLLMTVTWLLHEITGTILCSGDTVSESLFKTLKKKHYRSLLTSVPPNVLIFKNKPFPGNLENSRDLHFK